MTNWHAHRVWIALLAFAFFIGAGSAPALGVAQREAAQKLAALRTENEKTAAELGQMQDDIATAEKMKGEIGAREAEKILAPVDRLRAAQILERRAS